MVDLNKSANPESPPEEISQWLEEHGDLLYRFASSIAWLVTEGYKIITLKNVRLIIIRGLKMLKNTLHSDFFKLAFEDGTPKWALMTVLVVGTILTLINHGDVILEGGSLIYVKNFP